MSVTLGVDLPADLARFRLPDAVAARLQALSATLSNHPFYERLFAHFEAIGAYHSVWDEAD